MRYAILITCIVLGFIALVAQDSRTQVRRLEECSAWRRGQIEAIHAGAAVDSVAPHTICSR